jgi:uncharacterized protein (DUF58 family)
MRGSGLAGFVLVALGALTGQPGLLLMGVLLLLVEGLATLWSRRGLRGVTYERRFEPDRAVVGDLVALETTVTNQKLLPLAWLRVEDLANANMTVRELSLERDAASGGGIFRTIWTLAWFEQVRRRYHVDADRRGVYQLGPTELRVADLFGRNVATQEQPNRTTLLVRPRTVSVRDGQPDRAPLGLRRARSGPWEDPALFAGVRPFQLGDPLRRIHWRATARTGEVVSKRYEPSRSPEVVVAVDVQTHDGPFWLLSYDDETVEQLAVAAMSVARTSLLAGSSVGLAVAAFSGTPQRSMWIAPRGGTAQVSVIADALARMSPYASMPFGTLLAGLPQKVRPGATIVVLSGRLPSSYLATMQRLARHGYALRHLALGADAHEAVGLTRGIGVSADRATLNPNWKTADVLAVAG